MTSTTIEKEAVRLSDRLHAWWDRIQVQARLAEMDAQDAWQEVSRYAERTIRDVDHAARELEGAKDHANIQLHLGLMEAQQRAEDLESRLEEVWHRMQAAGEKVEGQVDLAALKAHLAKMDAEDYIEVRRSELRRAFERSRDEATSMLERGLERMNERIERLLGGSDHPRR